MQGPKEPSKHGTGEASSPAGGSNSQEARPQSPQVSRLLHDLNQPLSAINNYAHAGVQLIDKGLADTARLKDLFTKIAAQAARATALSQDMSKHLARGEQQS